MAKNLLGPDAEIDKIMQVLEIQGKEGFETTQRGICPEVAFASDREVAKFSESLNSKSMVFTDDAFMVGPFTFDNPSEYYNTELALFCNGSPELTAY